VFSSGYHSGHFFNVLAVYTNDYLNTASLYQSLRSVLGAGITSIVSNNTDGVWRVNAEAIANTGYIIILFQIAISKTFEKRPAIPSFMLGMFIAAVSFIVLGLSAVSFNALVFLGVFLFAVGEMISSPRIQEYILWIAPKEKAGLYMGANFLATFIGATLSGIYTGLMGTFEEAGNPEYIMYTLAGHILLGIVAIFIFTKFAGAYKELEQ